LPAHQSGLKVSPNCQIRPGDQRLDQPATTKAGLTILPSLPRRSSPPCGPHSHSCAGGNPVAHRLSRLPPARERICN